MNSIVNLQTEAGRRRGGLASLRPVGCTTILLLTLWGGGGVRFSLDGEAGLFCSLTGLHTALNRGRAVVWGESTHRVGGCY